MAGRMKTQPISKTMDLENAKTADTFPFPSPVNHAEAKRFNPLKRKLSI